jgi:hypothetical protein
VHGDDVGVKGSGQTGKTPDGRSRRSRVGLTVGVLSAGAVAAAAISDWPLSTLSAFWSGHAMLTNLVSSAVFAGFTIAVIERWLRQQEQRHSDAGRRAEQQRLTVVRSAAYNAVARGPIAQRRIMWFLVHGGDLRRVPEFEISTEHVRELRAVLARLGLAETSERDVMSHAVPRPGLTRRLAILSADEPWRHLVHDVLLDVVHNFRSLIARWSALLLTTDESLQALKDLAEQAEELSQLFVEFDGNCCGGEHSRTRCRSKSVSSTRVANGRSPARPSELQDAISWHRTTAPNSSGATTSRSCRCACTVARRSGVAGRRRWV